MILPWKWPLWLTWNDWIPSEGKLLVLYIDVGSLQLQRPCERSSSGWHGCSSLPRWWVLGHQTELLTALSRTHARNTSRNAHNLGVMSKYLLLSLAYKEHKKLGTPWEKDILEGLDLAASFEYVKLQNWLPSTISGKGDSIHGYLSYSSHNEKDYSPNSEKHATTSRARHGFKKILRNAQVWWPTYLADNGEVNILKEIVDSELYWNFLIHKKVTERRGREKSEIFNKYMIKYLCKWRTDV